MMPDGLIARVGRTVVHKVESPNKERFQNICSALGLNWIDTEVVGRDDPCPCGSGKKFKKCHGAYENRSGL